MTNSIRHGDVLVIPVEVIGELRLLQRNPRLGIVLAYGEKTGHSHHLLADDATLFEIAEPGKCSFRFDGQPLEIDTVGGGVPRVLDVTTATDLLHHDHGLGIPDGRVELTTPIAPGRYLVVRQRERSYADLEGYRRTED